MSYSRRSHKGQPTKGQPTKGWSKLSPGSMARKIMFKKCGKKCFLGPKKSFPICNKGTCKVNPKGVYSAYIRSRQWGKNKKTYKRSKPRHTKKIYKDVERKSKKILKKYGYKNIGNK